MTDGDSILFLHAGVEDYLADSLLHGLRTVCGPRVVEVPRHDAMYAAFPAGRRGDLYGHGFTLYGLLDDLEVDRAKALERARAGDFALVVFADIWRTYRVFAELVRDLERAGTRYVVVDGSDSPSLYPYGPHWWRRPRTWPAPRAHTRTTYFKREITPGTWWTRYYLAAPPPLHRVLPLRNIRPLAFSIPAEKLVAQAPPKDKDVGVHVVDEEVAQAVGGAAAYVFDEEADYYADLRRSRFGITTKRAGWDCMRHYEIAANGAVPCFRRLRAKPQLCAPHGLDDSNCVSYRDWDDLRRKLAALDDAGYARLQAGAMAWVRANTTEARARQFLTAVGMACD